ncbi:MAG: hypothetical protein ACJA2J_000269 [Candidatus Azotimanducaceae bacterium]|jgi:hypothetical protein
MTRSRYDKNDDKYIVVFKRSQLTWRAYVQKSIHRRAVLRVHPWLWQHKANTAVDISDFCFDSIEKCSWLPIAPKMPLDHFWSA